MSESIRLLVLSLTRYGDSSIILHALGEELGKCSLVVRLGKKTTTGLFQPLNILDCTVSASRRGALPTAHSFLSPYPLHGIRTNIRKNTMTLFMSEVLTRTIPEGDIDPDIFTWVEESVLTLEDLEGSFSNFHLWFLLELCSRIGFAPSGDVLAPFSGTNLPEIRALCDSSLPEALVLPLSGSQRNEMLRSILSYMEHHLQYPVKINSLDILGEVFSQ